MTQKIKRNNRLIDKWSFVHITTGVLCMWLLGSVAHWSVFSVWLLMALWEPVEIFLISPLLARVGVVFGYETWRNSLSDIVCNTIGICLALALKTLIS